MRRRRGEGSMKSPSPSPPPPRSRRARQRPGKSRGSRAWAARTGRRPRQRWGDSGSGGAMTRRLRAAAAGAWWSSSAGASSRHRPAPERAVRRSTRPSGACRGEMRVPCGTAPILPERAHGASILWAAWGERERNMGSYERRRDPTDSPLERVVDVDGRGEAQPCPPDWVISQHDARYVHAPTGTRARPTRHHARAGRRPGPQPHAALRGWALLLL